MKDRPRIYNFHDYREYLKALLLVLKTEKISMRKLSKEIGFSNAYLSMILKNKRNLDLKYIEGVSDFLKLNKSERNYFRNLVLLADSQDSEIRSNAYKELSKFKSYKTDKKDDVITHKYIKHWYYVAIRELSFMPEFEEKPEWIQSRLLGKITQKQASEALAFLKKHKLLQSDHHLKCTEGIYKLALTNFHKSMLQIVADSIEQTSRDKRMILGHTRALSREGYEKACDIMQEALNKINQIDDSPKNSELYHIYLTAVPLTLKSENEDEKDN